MIMMYVSTCVFFVLTWSEVFPASVPISNVITYKRVHDWFYINAIFVSLLLKDKIKIDDCILLLTCPGRLMIWCCYLGMARLLARINNLFIMRR